MRLGLRTALLLMAGGALAGCLTSNPNLEENEASAGEGSTAATDPTAGPTSGPTTTAGPSSGPPTTGEPTTDGPTTIGADTTDTDPTDPTSDTDETTGPAGCGGGNVCVGEAPAGWAGPVVWAETLSTDDAPDCPAAYPDLAFEAFDDLQAAPAECECACGSASGASCASITLEYHFSDSTCFSPDDEFTINPGGACNDGPNGGNSRYYRVPQPGVTSGNCPPAGTTDIADAEWSSASRLCGGATPGDGSCEPSQACVASPPDGFESRLCIWQSGDLECPASDYSDRFVRHQSVDDSRNCATCTCGNPEGDCEGTVVIYSQDGCSSTAALVAVIGGSCSQTGAANSRSARASGLSVNNVSCEASVGTAIGEAEPDDPYTLCCLTVE